MGDSKKELREKARQLRELAKKAERAAGGKDDGKREYMAQRSREKSRERREIGPLPFVKDPERRARCEHSTELFALTYFPNRFPWPFAACHRDSMDRMQTCTDVGGQFACALPRGSGKTTIAEVELIRAVVYGHRRFAVLIQATEPLAAKSLRKIQRELETNSRLAEDFPEVCYPIQALERIHNRANGQTLNGVPTRIEWNAHGITLPTVAGSPSSGSVIWVCGITGAVRGLSANSPDGGIIRPDLVLIDDAQTRDSAKSFAQTTEREMTIAGDVMGLAGPDVQIAALMLCTVIYPNDLSERHLDNEKNPDWQGIRTKMLEQFPKRMELWDQYDEIRRDAKRNRRGVKPANDFYIANRLAMDEGAVVSWPERIKKDEVSAIQGAMNLYFKNPIVFRAEYQNEPEPIDVGQVRELNADDIAGKVNNVKRSLLPVDVTRVTAMIDCQSLILFYVITGWSESFGGGVIEYGAFPRQNRSHFLAADPRPSLANVFPQLDEQERLYAGLKALASDIMARTFKRDGETAGEEQIAMCLVDSGWEDKTVKQFCRESAYRTRLIPSKGFGVTAGNAPVSEWKLRHPSERKGDNWRMRQVPERLLVYDANYWKTFVSHRLTAPQGAKGSLYLFGDTSSDHQLFAEHCTAEYRVETTGRGRTIEEWKQRPTATENHWWDCLVGSAVCANYLGLKFNAAGEGDAPPPKAKKPKRDLLAEFNARAAESGYGGSPPYG